MTTYKFMLEKNSIIPAEIIETKILILREKKVIIDADLATLYGVSTKVLNQVVKRNKVRFPEDFMFQISSDEKNIVVKKCDHLSKLKYSPYLPFAFTEHGIIMVASFLNSEQAIQVSVAVIRVFVKLKKILTENKNLELQLNILEGKINDHDLSINLLIRKIEKITEPVLPIKRKKIGL